MPEMSEENLLSEVERRLIGEYVEVPPDQISGAVRNAHAGFQGSKIRDFVPLLVERRARRELAKASQPLMV